MSKCIVIVATQNMRKTFFERALTSIKQQTIRPENIIIVNDGIPFSVEQEEKIKYILDDKYTVLPNIYTKGVAGAWNSALKFIYESSFKGFISILDDDDAWDANHLEENLIIAKLESADVVISGLRIINNNTLYTRKLPAKLAPKDFLIGNPGWQGSNTFVSMEVFKTVKGFRNGLLSTNDRDLAFRILSLTDLKVSYTNKWTSSWYVDSDDLSLSLPKSKSKIEGLRWFWYLYRTYFEEKNRNIFFERVWKLFQISEKEITTIGNNKPLQKGLLGDLDVK